MKHPYRFVTICILSLLACGGEKKESKDTVVPSTAQEAMKQAEEAIKKSAELQQTAEPVNFRTLKELLPQNIAGYALSNSSGETAGAMGIKISKAEGDYKNDAGNKLRLQIMDTGGLGMGMMSVAAWSTITVDKEDNNGYERTSTLNGYKSFEKYRKSGEDCQISILAHNRFVVNADCRGCSMDALKGVIAKIDLDKLKNVQ